MQSGKNVSELREVKSMDYNVKYYKYCPSCNAIILDDLLQCPNCGMMFIDIGGYVG